jgi:hypothetical protein
MRFIRKQDSSAIMSSIPARRARVFHRAQQSNTHTSSESKYFDSISIADVRKQATPPRHPSARFTVSGGGVGVMGYGLRVKGSKGSKVQKFKKFKGSKVQKSLFVYLFICLFVYLFSCLFV